VTLATATHGEVPAGVFWHDTFFNTAPRTSQLMRPLYEALKGKPARHTMDWSDRAFVDAKAALANATMLAHPSPKAPLAITTDALDYAVGAVHEQWVNGAWQLLTFFSLQ